MATNTNNITLQSGAPAWHSGVGNLYEDDIINWVNLSNFEQINNMQHDHSLLYNRWTDANGAVNPYITSDSAVGAYLTAIRDSYNGAWNSVNTKGINSGYVNNNGTYVLGTNRYGTVSTNPQSNDSAAQGWKTDNYYGAETDDRRLFGRINKNGQDDYTPAQLAEINAKLRVKGLELYLDTTDNYYKLRPFKSKTTGPNDPSSPAGPAGPTNPTGPKQYAPFKLPTREKPIKYPGWSDWVPLTANRVIDAIANTRTYLNDILKRFPRVTGPYLQAKVTDAYAERQQLNNLAEEVRARGGQNLTSDLQANIKQRVAYEGEAGKYDMQAIQAKAREFADTTKNVNAIANENIKTGSAVENANLKADAAAWNNIINARDTRIAKEAASQKQYNLDMYTNFGEYLKTKRVNEDGIKKRLTQAKYEQDYRDIAKPYQTLKTNKGSWNQLANFARELVLDPELSAEARKDPAFNKILAAAKNNQLPQALDDPTIQAYLVDKLENGDTNITRRYRQLYYTTLKDLESATATKLKAAYADYLRNMAGIWTYESNQWGWPTTVGGVDRRSVLMQKSGGKVDTLIDFVNDYRREQKSVRENAQKRNKLISENLNKQLDNLSKEELLLLRAVFK